MHLLRVIRCRCAEFRVTHLIYPEQFHALLISEVHQCILNPIIYSEQYKYSLRRINPRCIQNPFMMMDAQAMHSQSLDESHILYIL